MKQIGRVRKLSDIFGPDDSEDTVVVYAQEEVRGICTCKEDHIRNLYVNLEGNSQGGINTVLDTYSDEVGFIVQAAESNELLRFPSLGDWDMKSITTNKAFVKNRDDKLIPGIICSKPVYFMNIFEQGKVLDLADVLTDVGATSAQEIQESFRTGIGASIVPDIICTYGEEHQTFMGGTFDNRIGCAAVVETPRQLYGRTFANIISVTLSSQEEVGERGMTCVTNSVKLDVVICLEGCPADDNFEEEYMTQSALEKGPMLQHFDRSMIISSRSQRLAPELAHTNDISVQESVRKGGGANGGTTHMA